jgi:hypothetical protein
MCEQGDPGINLARFCANRTMLVALFVFIDAAAGMKQDAVLQEDITTEG